MEIKMTNKNTTNEDTLLDVMGKYFDYEFRVGRYKDLKILNFTETNKEEKSFSRLTIIVKTVLFLVFCFQVFTSQKVGSILTVICLLYVQFVNLISFASFYKKEELYERDNGKGNK